MRFIDAHIHLADPEYSSKIELVLQDAEENSVFGLVANAMDLATSKKTLSLSSTYPDLIHPAIGIHPWEAQRATDDDIEEVMKLISSEKRFIVSVGEIGLDGKYSTDTKNIEKQRTVFRRMLQAAEEAELPVSVHSRGAFQEVMETLSSFELPKVLLHWYSGPLELIPEIVSRGYYISMGPSSVYVTRLQEIARRTPLEQILVETDGPVSYEGVFKGRFTMPSFLKDVVENLTRIKSFDVENVSKLVFQNTTRFLRFG